jgi:hypothetical protein
MLAAMGVLTCASPTWAELHPTIYFQVVQPQGGPTTELEAWRGRVLSSIARHVSDLVDEEGLGLNIKLNRGGRNYAMSRYNDDEFERFARETNSMQISLVDNYEERGRTVSKTYVYFGGQKGDLPSTKITYQEMDSFKNPDRAANILKYAVTYALSVDLNNNVGPRVACRVLGRTRNMEKLEGVKNNSSLDPVRGAIAATNARLHCASYQ